ncbi:hypothetical protein M422DRAFT_773750 [Sphaerobolus stellatus SS14]|nr:hypothetical protein M422DRAFT_773750 [Sphaerobolus stellatus SS14]
MTQPSEHAKSLPVPLAKDVSEKKENYFDFIAFRAYEGFTVTSHVYPKFALLDAGITLDNLDRGGLFAAARPELVYTFIKIHDIYKAWTRKLDARTNRKHHKFLRTKIPEDDAKNTSTNTKYIRCSVSEDQDHLSQLRGGKKEAKSGHRRVRSNAQ